MAPLPIGVWWGPEAAAVGPGGRAAVSLGDAGGAPPLLTLAFAALAVLLLVSFLLLCAGCRGQKKAVNGHPAGDRADLMDGTSDKETISQLADSPATHIGVSASHNGPLTSGTILTDTQASSPQPSEDTASGQWERRFSKCPQGRELPSLPPSGSLVRGVAPPTSAEATYEMVKDISTPSRDVSVEDCLYETVKELKDPATKLTLPNGTAGPSPADAPAPPPPLPVTGPTPAISPGTPEYASVDRNKKSRYSADLEAKRRSAGGAKVQPEDLPPPLPEKVLDENDNQPALPNGHANRKSFENSAVDKASGDNAGVARDDKEDDYSSIAELKGLIPTGSSGDLYATVRDVYAQSAGDHNREGPDPGYESIRVTKTGEEDRDNGTRENSEPDYESVGELGLGREMSRL
ncbi:phosphoprotein associated with glycosphingolipid-enriched microdomains 1 [Stigmatopora nigra]